MKSWGDMKLRALVRARRAVLRTQLDLANAVRGCLRTVGLSLRTTGGARGFEAQVRARLAERPDLEPIVLPMLETWRVARRQVYQHDRTIRAIVRGLCALPAADDGPPGWDA